MLLSMDLIVDGCERKENVLYNDTLNTLTIFWLGDMINYYSVNKTGKQLLSLCGRLLYMHLHPTDRTAHTMASAL